MNVSINQLMQVFTPLLVALHEKGVLDIAEVPHFYEDAVIRRKYNLGEKDEDTEFQRELVTGLHRLAAALKAADQNRPS